MIDVRDPARIPILLDLVREIWQLNPQLRLAQIVTTAVGACSHYYVEDDILEASLRKMLATAKADKLNPPPKSKRTL